MSIPLTQRLATRIRSIRHTTGLSQEDYAKHIGIHRTYMSALERGVRNPTLQSIEKLAEKMGVEPLSLLLEDLRHITPQEPPLTTTNFDDSKKPSSPS